MLPNRIKLEVNKEIFCKVYITHLYQLAYSVYSVLEQLQFNKALSKLLLLLLLYGKCKNPPQKSPLEPKLIHR